MSLIACGKSKFCACNAFIPWAVELLLVLLCGLLSRLGARARPQQLKTIPKYDKQDTASSRPLPPPAQLTRMFRPCEIALSARALWHPRGGVCIRSGFLFLAWLAIAVRAVAVVAIVALSSTECSPPENSRVSHRRAQRAGCRFGVPWNAQCRTASLA